MHELETLDRLEAAEEVDMRAWMDEFERILTYRTPEQRAYIYIKNFFRIDNPGEEAYRKFIGWLIGDYFTDVKYKALERVLDEITSAEEMWQGVAEKFRSNG